MTLHPFPVPSVRAALVLLSLARSHGLSASYHPSGGATAKRYVTPSHTVWVVGTKSQIERLKAE